MKRISLALLGLLAALAASGPARASDDDYKLFVAVTAADAQTQAMAMVLSLQSRQQGAAVQVLLCGPGGDMALKGAPQTVLKPKGTTPQGLLKKLIGTGAQVDVCALYLPNSGKMAGDLIEGVGVAKPPAIAGALLAEDTRLFTF